MREFEAVRVFLKIVEMRGVSVAARALGMPRSTVSRHLTSLEASLGVRLVQRSTRSFGLTEEGALVHLQFQRIAEAEATIVESLSAPVASGVLRVTAPYSFAMSMIAPLLPSFMAEYPDLSVSIDMSVKQVDLIGEDFDVALRAGRIENSSLVGRRLGVSPFVLCASPAYLDSAPDLLEPQDLVRHAVLAFHHVIAHPRSWTLKRGDEQVTVQFVPRIAANDAGILLQAAIDGVGLTCLPRRLCRDHIASGALRVCLPGWFHGEAEVYALYPSRRGLSPKVRVFIDHLARQLDFAC